MEQVINLIAFLVIAIVATISGSWILAAAGLKTRRWVLDFALAGGAGLVFLALLTAGTAFLHLLWLPPWFLLVLLSGVAFLLHRLFREGESFSRPDQVGHGCEPVLDATARSGTLGKIAGLLLVGLVTVHLLLNLLAAMAPVTGVDSLIYHLSIPKIYLLAGGMTYLPSMYQSAWPLLIQMIFLFAQWFQNAEVAQMMNFWAVFLSCLVIYELAGGRTRRIFALVAVLLYLSISDVIYQSSIALVDVAAALFLLLAFAALTIWLQARQTTRWLVLSGVLAGAFAAGRISNAGLVIALIAALIAVILMERWQDGQSLPARLAPAAVISAAAFLVVLPWHLRSWWYTGNPIYPYLYAFFGGLNFSAEAAAYLTQLSFFKTVGSRSLGGLLTLPWDITMDPHRFRSGVIGPVLLTCLPLVAIYRRQMPSSWFRLAVFFSAAALPIWYLTYVRVRSLLPVVALLMVLTVLGIGALLADLQVAGWFKIIVVGVLVAWLGTGLLTNFYHHTSAAAVTLGLKNPNDYLRASLTATGFGWFDDFQLLNKALPSQARLLIWEDRGFYLDREYLWASGLARGLASFEELQDSERLVRRLEQWGVTHLVWGRAASASKELERLRQLLMEGKTPTLLIYQSPRLEVRKILFRNYDTASTSPEAESINRDGGPSAQ